MANLPTKILNFGGSDNYLLTDALKDVYHIKITVPNQDTSKKGFYFYSTLNNKAVNITPTIQFYKLPNVTSAVSGITSIYELFKNNFVILDKFITGIQLGSYNNKLIWTFDVERQNGTVFHINIYDDLTYMNTTISNSLKQIGVMNPDTLGVHFVTYVNNAWNLTAPVNPTAPIPLGTTGGNILSNHLISDGTHEYLAPKNSYFMVDNNIYQNVYGSSYTSLLNFTEFFSDNQNNTSSVYRYVNVYDLSPWGSNDILKIASKFSNGSNGAITNVSYEIV